MLPMTSYLPLLFPVQGAKGQEGERGVPGAAGNPVSPALPAPQGLGLSHRWTLGSQLWVTGEGPGNVQSLWEGLARPGAFGAAETKRGALASLRAQCFRALSTCPALLARAR